MSRVVDRKRAVFCLIIVAMAYFWTNFHRQSMAVLAPYLMEEMGITTSQVGTLGSIMFYVYGLTQIPFGLIADKYGSKRIIEVCLVSMVIGTYIFGHAKNYTQLMIGRLITGFAVSGIYVPSLSMIRGWFDIRVYSTYLGIYLAVGNLGSVLSTTPFEILLSNFEISTIYNVFAIIVLFLSIASFFLYEKPKSKVKVEMEKTSDPKEKHFYIFLASICLLGLLYNGGRQGFQSLWGTTYYISVFNYSIRNASIMMMIFSIGGIFFSPIAGWIADHFGRFNALIKMSMFTSIIWLIVGVTPINSNYIVIGFMAFLLGGVNSSTIQNAFTTLGDYAKPRQRSLISAVLNTSNFFGSAIFTQSLGIIFEGRTMNHTTFLVVFVVFAVLILMASIIAMFTKNNLDKNLGGLNE
ncbi:MAG: MFS transporter [Tissierellia bacterium]|nr:MFS transporter [Tissierellia bacterium]